MKNLDNSLSLNFIRRGMALMPKCVTAAALVVGLLTAPAAHAAITYSGDISPDTDPATWDTSIFGIIGNVADGTMTIDGGSQVVSWYGKEAQNAGVAGTVTVTGPGSTWTGTAINYVGWHGTGILNITNGGYVKFKQVVLGFEAPGQGIVTVDGAGSTLFTTNQSVVGNYTGTSGLMKITNGGTVTNSGGTTSYYSIGKSDGSTGTVIVNGSGSSFNMYSLGLGALGSPIFASSTTGKGKLSISDGGAVTATSSVRLGNTYALMTVDLGKGSSLSVGSGTLTNNGTVRLVAGAGAANGTYTPITAGTWDGTGSVQALGGIWDAASHTVTVSSAATGAAGAALTADLSTTQRFLFTDASTGKSVGAAFQAAAGPTNLTLTASSVSGSALGSLQSQLGSGEAVLSAFDFTTEGYTESNPVYLSLFAGSGHSLYDLTIWHYDGSDWAEYDATDLAYDKTYASFTVNGFSGYAVSGTAPVPIPAAAWLLGSGVIGLAGIRRRTSAC
jgi:T5SS/PEP-CTERM-associated repeat protein